MRLLRKTKWDPKCLPSPAQLFRTQLFYVTFNISNWIVCVKSENNRMLPSAGAAALQLRINSPRWWIIRLLWLMAGATVAQGQKGLPATLRLEGSILGPQAHMPRCSWAELPLVVNLAWPTVSHFLQLEQTNFCLSSLWTQKRAWKVSVFKM